MIPKVHEQLKEQLSKVMRGIAVLAPEIMEILIWIPVRLSQKPQSSQVLDDENFAYATKTEIYVLPRFFELSLKQQATVLIHNMWHVALRHIAQIKKFNAHPIIANLAMNALINQALESSSKLNGLGIELPPGSVTVSDLEDICSQQLDKPWQNYNWYELYLWLLRNLPRTNSEQGIPVDLSFLPEDLKNAGQNTHEAPLNIRLDIGNFQPNLDFAENLSGQNGEDTDDVEEHLQEQLWNDRISRLHGTAAGNWLTAFQGLLPQRRRSVWPSLLKKYLQDWAYPLERDYSYRRLHRYFITDIVPYPLPSLNPQIGLVPLAVVIDTSGSISDEDLHLFAGVVDWLRHDFNLDLELHLIQADADVQNVVKIDPGQPLKPYLKQGFKGRGGTNFAPALTKAQQLGAKLCIYLTDLYGNFGPKPKGMDVIWVVNHNQLVHFPFGKIVRISQIAN